MPVFEVNVKWGKEKFEKVECNTDEPPLVFKATLFSLSGVHPSRQKVLFKGTTVKDDAWDNVKIANNSVMMLMGSAEEIPSAPTTKVVFMEDMSEKQLAQAMEMPSGLTNLGNTCYMNATLQCLKAVPELKEAVQKYRGSITDHVTNPDQSITAAVHNLFESMDKTSGAVPPIIMLNVLHMCYPRFAEKSDHGGFQQQDANECWTELVRCLQRNLPAFSSENAGQEAPGGAMAVGGVNYGFIDQFFGIRAESTMKCLESEDEQPTTSTENFLQLSCFIEKEVKYMHTGLKSGLEGEIEKTSPSLGRLARYQKHSRLSRLPAYLAIQMVRFFYKNKEAVNAKIMKDIKFPASLDVYDLCTTDLQQKLVIARDKFKEEDDRLVEYKDKVKGSKSAPTTELPGKQQPYSFPDDIGSNNSGFYELQAVLTHKGRSSSSGHYVAWVRTKKPDEWFMFDDDNVSIVYTEDVLKLSGGGDWHCAYVLLYGPRILTIHDIPVIADESMSTTEATPMSS